jgi:hypothetical protein
VSNDTGPVAGSGGDGAFGGQMRGYSRRQVDAFAAKTRSQIQDLTERLSRSLGEVERLRTELSAARQALRHQPAQEPVSARVGRSSSSRARRPRPGGPAPRRRSASSATRPGKKPTGCGPKPASRPNR